LNHIHCLIQRVSSHSITKCSDKKYLSREISKRYPEVKKTFFFWGSFFIKGYYPNEVGQHGIGYIFSNYVKNKEKEEKYSG